MNLRSSPTTGQLQRSASSFLPTGIRKLKLKSSQIVKPGQRTMDGALLFSRGTGPLGRSPKLQDSILYSSGGRDKGC